MLALDWINQHLPGSKKVATPPLFKERGQDKSCALIQKFKREHLELMDFLSEANMALGRYEYWNVPLSLERFRTVMEAHLLDENVNLYWCLEDRLIRNPDGMKVMREFRREMLAIGRSVREFIRKYRTEGIGTDNHKDFERELHDIRNTLAARLEREEQQLYVLYRA